MMATKKQPKPVVNEATSHTVKITKVDRTEYSGIFYDYIVDAQPEQRFISERKFMEVVRDIIRDGVPVSIITRSHATVTTANGTKMQVWGGAEVKK